AFSRMAERIEESERRTLASAEVTEALTGDSLEDEFAQLERGGEMDDRLLALKQEMGLIAAPSDAEWKKLGAGEAADDDEAEDRDSDTDGLASGPDGGKARADADAAVHEAELLEEFDRLERGGAN
ncbi:MAG: hypothetical protein WD120_02425, partial [Gemmatimonadota bacterium]